MCYIVVLYLVLDYLVTCYIFTHSTADQGDLTDIRHHQPLVLKI